MKVTKQVELQFADGLFSVDFQLERLESADRKHSIYRLDAVTPTGFDLTAASYGLLKSRFETNKRLRSPKSIQAEMDQILNDIIEYCLNKELTKRFVLKSLTLKHTLDESEWQFFKQCEPFPTCSIKSKESGNPISWYYHDVFNTDSEIEITFTRLTSGQLTAHASELELYDLTKLQKLADSERFKEQKFAFFFYNEVNRLLNKPIQGNPSAMSGLFASK